jgi:tRNA (guanine-N7-)-methyltransferase
MGSDLQHEGVGWALVTCKPAVLVQTEGVRVRQHVNPLKRELQVPLPPQDWAAIYPDAHRPLIVDVGCGSGRFLMALSHRFKHHNLLGLDIRRQVSARP